jgi:hypothetical protein
MRLASRPGPGKSRDPRSGTGFAQAQCRVNFGRESPGPLGLSRPPLSVADRQVPARLRFCAHRYLPMHARELVEVAAVLAAHGPVLIRGAQWLPSEGLEQYWTASKCRMDRWGRALKRAARDLSDADPKRREARWPAARGLLEEILTGEVLTRVWAAVLCAHDRQHGTDRSEPIARSVLIGHLEARHRVLTLLIRGPGVPSEAGVKLNHLRRRSERWTDMLVGYLASRYDVSQLAVDSRRAKDFADDLRLQWQQRGGSQVWPLVQVSVRAAFRQGLAPSSPNADLNRSIASSILACFPPELFDSTGVFRSLWLLRLSEAATDAQGLVEDLLRVEQPGSKPSGLAARRLSDRLRRFGGERPT